MPTSCPPTTDPVVITPIKSTELHAWWPLLERGLKDIARKVQPDHIPPDVYGAIRAEAATACIVSRGSRILGFFVYHRQERPWSHKLDIFCWALWMLPLRERLPTDNVTDALWRCRDYLHEIKRSFAAERVIGITGRKGAERRYGVKLLYMTVEIP